jgi:hypothetical protein
MENEAQTTVASASPNVKVATGKADQVRYAIRYAFHISRC